MDQNNKFPAMPGMALSQVSLERINQQRCEQNTSPTDDASRIIRESSVHEKVAKFDSLASQGKVLERKTADAALKRAMLGREQAESEMRRYRGEARALRNLVEEGKDRERKVGERLESVMENYGRAKETHAHTQSLWEKEIRRARKEAFKSQSVVVKLQEELKAIRLALRTSQSHFDEEKERSSTREQEAFAARYQLVSVQEELTNMIERVKLVEQERDALKMIAKNEEIARIAAEGQLPLPPSSKDDEFASPRKASKPLAAVPVTSSAASEEELTRIKTELEWERHRADRAYELVEYMQIECQFRHCSCRAIENRGQESVHVLALQISKVESSPFIRDSAESPRGSEDTHKGFQKNNNCQSPISHQYFGVKPPHNIFDSVDGVFSTVPPSPEESPWISPAKSLPSTQIYPHERSIVHQIDTTFNASAHARTPSCEPPSVAMVPGANTSLLSILDSFHSASEPEEININRCDERPKSECEYSKNYQTDDDRQDYSISYYTSEESSEATQTSVFHTISTTTRIPLANPQDITPPNFSGTGDALSPTMTREEALAQIRERRGRARSLAQGTLTPRKQMVTGAGERRDCSAPAVRSTSGGPKGRNNTFPRQ